MIHYLCRTTGIALALTYVIALFTVNALLRLSFDIATDEATRQQVAIGLGLLVLFFPTWWLQWRWLRWQLQETTANIHQPPAQLSFERYQFTVALIALFFIFGSAGMGVVVLVRLVLGVLVDSALGWVQSLTAVVAMLLATGIWALHWHPRLKRHHDRQMARISHPAL